MTTAHTHILVDQLEEIPLSKDSRPNRWALLRKGDKLSALFQYDQMKLRYQYAITREYLPKPSWWKKKKIKKDIEMLFEDVDQEIYFQGQLSKEVKGEQAARTRVLSRAQREREDMEEVLTGYDKFTVEEEQKITEMTKKAIQRLTAEEKEKGII
ncbi:MAG: hypothetical protein V1703_01525 [Candidatus Altiarchaeota archaeon]